MDFIQTVLYAAKDLVAWLPSQVIAFVILALAALIALSLHRMVRKLIRRLLAERYPFAFSIFSRMRGVTRLALLVLAMFVVIIPRAPPPGWHG